MARGTKTGGRKAGTPNRATVERQEMAARALDNAKAEGRPLAKDRLDELLGIALGAMTAHQPITKDIVKKARALGNKAVKESRGNWSGFGEWWDRAAYAARSWQSTRARPTRRFPLRPRSRPAPASFGDFDNIGRLGDPVAASRAYQQFMRAPRQRALPPPAAFGGSISWTVRTRGSRIAFAGEKTFEEGDASERPKLCQDHAVEPGGKRIQHVFEDLRIFPACPRRYIKGMISFRNSLRVARLPSLLQSGSSCSSDARVSRVAYCSPMGRAKRFAKLCGDFKARASVLRWYGWNSLSRRRR